MAARKRAPRNKAGLPLLPLPGPVAATVGQHQGGPAQRPIIVATQGDFATRFADNDSLWSYVDGMRAHVTPAFEKRLGFNRSPVYYEDDMVRTWIAGVLLGLRDVVVDRWRLERVNGEKAQAAAYRGWAIRTVVRYLVGEPSEREALEGLMRMQPLRSHEERDTAMAKFKMYLFDLVARAADVPPDSLAFVLLAAGIPGDDNYE